MLSIAVEEIAKACAASSLILMVQDLGSLPIALFGSDEQKQRLFPKLASGEWSPAFALSEPEAGSDPASMRTSAKLDGDEWVINGTKNWISNAGVADFYVVMASTDRENRKTTAFIVEKDREGFSIGGYEHKMGIKGSPTGSPVLEDVRVPQENVIGEVDKGLAVALGTLERTRLGAAAQAVGIAQGAIDYADAVREGARHLRQADLRAPGDRLQARRDGGAHRRRARADLPRQRGRRPRRAGPREVDVDGQADRVGHRDVGDDRGRPGARRVRLRQRLSGRAHDARREDHADLRGHERDPAARDLALDAIVHGERYASCTPDRLRSRHRTLRGADRGRAARRVQREPRRARNRDDRRDRTRRCGDLRRGDRDRPADGRLGRSGDRGGVRQGRRCAASGSPPPGCPRSRAKAAFLDLDPWDDDDFEELVREAIDDIPDLLRVALERNVAVVISDQGFSHRAYGLYQGDGAHRDNYPDRIIIFRDTLRRDFGHDSELLRTQVTITVRHELAHHIGFDELGVRDLGL